MPNQEKIQSIIGVVFVAIVLLLISISTGHKPSTEPVTVRQSIEKGLGYIDSNPDKVTHLQWLLVDYLQRKFDLDTKFAALNREIKVSEGRAQVEYEVFKRMAYPNELVQALPEESDPVNKMVMASMHCDHIPLPADFDVLVEQNIKDGGYGLTHAAFSLENMTELGCSTDRYQPRWPEIHNKLAALAEGAESPDLRYEATAMLMHVGRHDMVKPQWIDRITKEQDGNGGWKAELHDSNVNDHATALALWALLEFTDPDVPDEPMLHKLKPSLA